MNTDLRLPAAQDMERAATELASDALIMGAGLRQITADLRQAHQLLDYDVNSRDGLDAIRQGRELVEAAWLTLTEAGY
jgi:hypothetical protein